MPFPVVESHFHLSRRQFAKSLALAGAAVAAGQPVLGQNSAPVPAKRQIKLGYDNFALRAFGWKAAEHINYAASLRLDSLFLTDLQVFENLEENYLKELKAKAIDQGLQIHVGTWSICPSSKSFRNNYGTAEEHLALGIRVAKALGSPVVRVVLGGGEDRKSEGGIEARIRDTVQVCQALRTQAIDSGVKIAVENHAGDMQAWELVTLIEEAGKDYVGANIDSGNAVWALEDPLMNLEILGPYVLTSSLRDAAIWEYTDGAKVQWTAIGEGNIDFKAYFQRFADLCPTAPVHIETISGFPREIPYLRNDFWQAFPKARAREFARFVALAKRGKAIEPFKVPEGKDRKEAEKEYQKGELERSLKHCKEVLGLGLKT